MIDEALTGIIPNERERAFVLRCILEEGPRHHRVASWTLLQLLATVLVEAGGVDASASPHRTHELLGMRLPPNVATACEDAEFPIGVPTGMIREVMGRKEADLALECLRDGPPHHALANAAMTWMIQSIYERIRRRVPPMDGDE